MQDSEIVKAAEARISDLGLPLPSRMVSTEDVVWPENVADLTSEELARHLTWWSGWQSYAQYHLARAETNHASLSKHLAIEVQKILHNSGKDYKTVTEAKAAVARLPSIEKIEHRVTEADANKRLLSALVEGYEVKYATISREISRRGQDFSKGGR